MQASIFLVIIAGLGFLVITRGASVTRKQSLYIAESQLLNAQCMHQDRTKLFDQALKRLRETAISMFTFFKAWNSVKDIRSPTDQAFEQFKADLERNCTKYYSPLRDNTNRWIEVMNNCYEYDSNIVILKTNLWWLDYICDHQDKMLESVLNGGVNCSLTITPQLLECGKVTHETMQNLPSNSSERFKACETVRVFRQQLECSYQVHNTCPNSTYAEMINHIIQKLPKTTHCNGTTNVP